jgi:ABC-type Co2+ transport system permease subunit
MIPLLPPLWAVHISDGMLTPAWCAGGFVVAGLLVLWAAWRIREEEIPQLAILTAAFFLAGLLHVPVPGGPKTHLLLNGLLGVVLGRRAMLAVVVGLFLQSLTVMEGVGFSTLGANACVMGLPAYAAWGLFAGLQRLPGIRHLVFRAALVGLSTAVFFLSMVYAVVALVSNYLAAATLDLAGVVSNHPAAATLDLARANAYTFHPATLAAALLLAGAAVWVERRLEHAAEFPVGLLIGELTVLVTIFLNGLVLMLGGTSNWTGVVLLTYVIHLPLAVIEGIILGFTVGFLARVKPQLLYGYRPPPVAAPSVPVSSAVAGKVVAVLLVPVVLLACARPAYAHRLEAEYHILPERRIQIEAWFDLTGDSANGAEVQVLRPDGQILTTGKTDAGGLFVFTYDRVEALTVKVNAGMGHAKELTIPAANLTAVMENKQTADSFQPSEDPKMKADRTSHFQFRDILIVLGFIFGVAAFVLTLRHGAALRELQRQQQKNRHTVEGEHKSAATSVDERIITPKGEYNSAPPEPSDRPGISTPKG